MFWYDGRLCSANTLELDITDPGLLYGATVFTTLRVYDRTLKHSLTQWQKHCDRLLASIEVFGWSEPDWERTSHGAKVLSDRYPVLRVAIFPDGREWITGRSLPPDLTRRQQQGIVAWLACEPQFRRSLPVWKTGNYLPAWLALQGARKHNAKEAILTDDAGNWLETSTGNLWGWREGCWWTPPLEAGILPGLMRTRLLDTLQQQQTVMEVPWTPEVVKGFDAIAYTNSVVEIVPIHTVLICSHNSCPPSYFCYPNVLMYVDRLRKCLAGTVGETEKTQGEQTDY
ncbi:aminotransferase class IV [Oscillatoriales cyanobacterium LEGE 11467]|uniref:Aminotransferase class IV n=1 Tax=Zarconia navalis LEGE 11467 TaxID=1828826 RepID=A0A928Z9G5_9CYAN|nr:aminotransferase class IV [Zarconia navalis LEGE 11467]